MTSDPPRTPVRTCVGCRRRDEQTALLRVVAVRDESTATGWLLEADERIARELEFRLAQPSDASAWERAPMVIIEPLDRTIVSPVLEVRGCVLMWGLVESGEGSYGQVVGKI